MTDWSQDGIELSVVQGQKCLPKHQELLDVKRGIQSG